MNVELAAIIGETVVPAYKFMILKSAPGSKITTTVNPVVVIFYCLNFFKFLRKDFRNKQLQNHSRGV